MAGVDPRTISYVEAHGTGTALGDPIEVAALSAVLPRGHRRARLVRHRLGEVEHRAPQPAAGIVGVIKAVLALEHGLIPPTHQLRDAQPGDRLRRQPVLRRRPALTKWDTDGRAPAGRGQLVRHRRHQRARGAGGGAGARPASDRRGPAGAAAAAVGPDRRRRWTPPWRGSPTTWRTPPPAPELLADVALHAAGRAGSEYPHRVAVVAADRGRRGRPRCATAAPAPARGGRRRRAAGGVPVLRPGGPVRRDGRASSTPSEPAFAAAVDECAELLAPELGLDLRELILGRRPQAADDSSPRPRYTQPALFAVEYALAQLWQPAGRPAGGDDRPLDRRVRRRHRRRRASPAGRAAAGRRPGPADAVDAGRGDAGRRAATRPQVAARLPDGLAIAAVNGPGTCVVAGAERRGRRVRRQPRRARIESTAAAHLARVPLADDGPDPGRVHRADGDGAAARAAACRSCPTSPAPGSPPSRPPTRRTGRRTCASRSGSATAWPTLLGAGTWALLECGPGRQLASLARMQVARAPRSSGRWPRWAACPARGEPAGDLACLLASAGALWCAGVAVRLDAERRPPGGCRCRRTRSSGAATGSTRTRWRRRAERAGARPVRVRCRSGSRCRCGGRPPPTRRPCRRAAAWCSPPVRRGRRAGRRAARPPATTRSWYAPARRSRRADGGYRLRPGRPGGLRRAGRGVDRRRGAGPGACTPSPWTAAGRHRRRPPPGQAQERGFFEPARAGAGAGRAGHRRGRALRLDVLTAGTGTSPAPT